MNKGIIKCLKNSIGEKGNYCYSLPVETTKAVIKELNRLNKEYERIYNENCKLREEHNITDIKLLDENNRLNNIIDELEKWLKKEHENGYEVYYLMAIQDILDKLKELKEENK